MGRNGAMRTLLRTICVVFVLFGLTAACGDDKDSKTPATSPTPQTTLAAPGTTAQTAGATTTVPSSVFQNVTDGSTCNPAQARGTTAAGRAMVCTTIAGGNELRWRPA
jgi:ABC-type phosphate transport system substrate-binding protein